MFEPYEQTPEFATIEVIAEAIRRELGTEVEACPGSRSPDDAEPLNRVFRGVVRPILRPALAPGHELSALVSWTLHRLARRRLASGGLNDGEIEALLHQEPGAPDDWAAFLILVPWTEVLFWLAAEDSNPG